MPEWGRWLAPFSPLSYSADLIRIGFGEPGYWSETIDALALAGYVALLLIPLIIGTIVTVHGKNGWMFSNKDGGWEFPAFWALALGVLFLLGDGAWTLVPSPHWF